VGFGKTVGYLNSEIDGASRIQRVSGDDALQRLAGNEFECKINATGIVPRLVERGDVRMRHRHRLLRIRKKPRARRRAVLDVVGRNRQRDRAPKPRIACAKLFAKRALAETFENPVVRDGLQDAAIILAALYLSLLRQNRNFRLLYIGQAISQLGDWFNTVAVYALLLDLTGSATAVAWMLIVQLLPIAIVGPLAGVVVDRLNRRRIMVAADILRGSLILGLLLVRRADQIWIAYVVTACTVAATAFFEPARTATIPNVTSPDQLLPANALASATWSAMLAIGASVGGVVTAVFGRDAAFVINSASFFISAVFIVMTRYDATPRRRPRVESIMAISGIGDLIEGLRYIRREAHVAALLLVKTGWGLAGGILLLLTIFGQRVFPIGRSAAAGIGVLYGARGVGAALGPIALRWMLGQEPSVLRRSIGAAFFMIGGFYAALSFASVLPLAAACVLFAHCGGSILWVFSTVLLQFEVPDEFRGRVFAAELALFTFASALSSYFTGFYLDRGASPRTVSLVLGGLFFLPGAVWMLILSRWQQRAVSAGRPNAFDDRDEVLRVRIS
jgi:MFS family permease